MSTSCKRPLTRMEKDRLWFLNYGLGPKYYFIAVLIVGIAAVIAMTRKDFFSYLSLAGTVVGAALILWYYRSRVRSSFVQMRDNAFGKSDDGKWCIRDNDAFEQFKDEFMEK